MGRRWHAGTESVRIGVGQAWPRMTLMPLVLLAQHGSCMYGSPHTTLRAPRVHVYIGMLIRPEVVDERLRLHLNHVRGR